MLFPLNRKRVYEIIDTERKYQDSLWPEAASTHEFIMYMDAYLTDLKQKLVDRATEEEALNVIRKITAMGVACMEQNGGFERK